MLRQADGLRFTGEESRGKARQGKDTLEWRCFARSPSRRGLRWVIPELAFDAAGWHRAVVPALTPSAPSSFGGGPPSLFLRLSPSLPLPVALRCANAVSDPASDTPVINHETCIVFFFFFFSQTAYVSLLQQLFEGGKKYIESLNQTRVKRREFVESARQAAARFGGRTSFEIISPWHCIFSVSYFCDTERRTNFTELLFNF